MLLASAFPVLTVQIGDEWRRKVETTAGDFIFNEVADYEVTVITTPGVEVFTSGTESSTKAARDEKIFKADALRDFVILTGRGLKSEQIESEGVTVRSIYQADHERVGKRALVVAANSLRVFTSIFGPLPFKMVSVAEAPLVAGLGSSEFSGFNIIASAFYVDFDSPAVRNSARRSAREQRPSFEESLEWSVAHLVAISMVGRGRG